MQHPYPDILSVAQSYAADQAAIKSGTHGYILMENAGRVAAEYISERFKNRQALILCGPGNNGGDGYVVARLLANKGWHIRIAATTSDYFGDAALMVDKWLGKIEILSADTDLTDIDLVIDAVFGIGFKGAIPQDVAILFDRITKNKIDVVALDIPSGMAGDTGDMDVATLKAAATVTFGNKKIAHVIYPSRHMCGDVIVADIGISYDAVLVQKSDIFENIPSYWLADYPQKTPEKHKYDYGCVTVFGGGVLSGAAIMAAQSAMRIGAGAAVIMAPHSARQQYHFTGHEHIMFEPMHGQGDVHRFLSDKRKNACVIGPGNGVNIQTTENVMDVLSLEHLKIVLDADALSTFKNKTEMLFMHTNINHVLTPHAGEFARLFPDLKDLPKMDQARQAAKSANAIIVLKGADTMIAHPDGRLVINTNAPPYLATAGAGDVLAGMIAGLMAQHMEPYLAACAAVWLHGQAAQEFGMGLLATDLPETLPKVIQSLLSDKNTC